MNEVLIWGGVVILGFRLVPWGLRTLTPGLYRRLGPVMTRLLALLDIGGGLLMLIIVGAMFVHSLWLPTAIFACVAIPNLRAMVVGFRTLMRLAAKDMR